MTYMKRLERGAEIIINDWTEIKEKDKLLIVTTHEYALEASKMEKYALKRKANVDIMFMQEAGIHVGEFFDENEKAFDGYNIIIGATDYSLVTTRATKRAVEKGSKYLSLPLSVGNGESMLSHDFIQMDTKESKFMADRIIKDIEKSSMIQIVTDIGTDLKVYKENRDPGFFSGSVNYSEGYSSASFEIYVPIEETRTEGTMVVDGSLGYIGLPKEPVKIEFANGRVTEIEGNESGKILKNYIEGYNDPNMYIAAELGIGLNTHAKTQGRSYIEDESAYKTFHIGFGR